MEFISSRQNPRIKKMVRLHSSRGRQQQNRIAIFGSREIERAIASGIEPEELFFCTELVDEKLLTRIQDLMAMSANATGAGLNFDAIAFSVTTEIFEKICFGDRSDGAIMTAKRPEQTIAQFFTELRSKPIETPMIAVAESIEKPGNLGAILRSADGAGIDGLIVAGPVTDWFHPNTIRSSLGTCFSVLGCQSDTATVQRMLIEEGFQVLVASLQSSIDFYEADFAAKTAIVLGSEANGVSDSWNRCQFQAVRLPMLGIADSLNVSAAATAMFYEARRQRNL